VKNRLKALLLAHLINILEMKKLWPPKIKGVKIPKNIEHYIGRFLNT
jgi:hypothetical protein